MATAGGHARVGAVWTVLAVVFLIVAASGCAGTTDGSGAAGEVPPSAGAAPFDDAAPIDLDDAEFEAPECSSFTSWRDAQDALELDSEYAAFLDADGDGGACQELAQAEYEDGWATAYPEACAAIFFDSPDGYLYSSGLQYESFDCKNADPGPEEWDFSMSLSEEPETDGAHDGWEAACAATFLDVVGDDLYWGDDEVWVTQADCDVANAY